MRTGAPTARPDLVVLRSAIRFYHFFLGPALWFRPAPEDAGLDTAPTHVPDYRIRKDEDGNEFKGELARFAIAEVRC